MLITITRTHARTHVRMHARSHSHTTTRTHPPTHIRTQFAHLWRHILQFKPSQRRFFPDTLPRRQHNDFSLNFKPNISDHFFGRILPAGPSHRRVTRCGTIRTRGTPFSLSIANLSIAKFYVGPISVPSQDEIGPDHIRNVFFLPFLD